MFGSFEFFAKSVKTNIKVSLYIPDKLLKEKKEDLKVLYLLHGYSGDNESWFLGTPAIAYADKYDVAIVSPMAHNGFYSNNVYGSLNYFDLVEMEVPKFLYRTFGIMKHKENTFLGGLSMGGYGAMKLALLSDKFSAVASFSGGLIPLDVYVENKGKEEDEFNLEQVFFNKGKLNENACIYELTKRNKDNLKNVFISCGTNDEIPYLYEGNLKYMECLDDNNVKYESYIDDETHSYVHWSIALGKYFEFLKKKGLI